MGGWPAGIGCLVVIAGCTGAAPTRGPHVIARSGAEAGSQSTAGELCDAFKMETRNVKGRAEKRKRKAFDEAIARGDATAETRKRLAEAEIDVKRFEFATRSNPPDRARQAMLESSKREVAKLREMLAHPPPVKPAETIGLEMLPSHLGECTVTSDGVWALVLEDLDLGDWRDCDSCDRSMQIAQARWVVAYAGFNGVRARHMPKFFLDRPSRPGMTPSNCCNEGVAEVEAPRPVAFDYNGDGRAELAITVSYRLLSLTNSERETWGRILTVSGDHLDAYGPAKQIGPAEVRDVDRDGRPDLIERDQHETCPPDPCDHECGCYPEDGPDIVWLSNRDGTFRKAPISVDDGPITAPKS